MEHAPTWPRTTDDKPGERERKIAEVLASVGAKVVQTGEARKMTKLDSEEFAGLPPDLINVMQEFADRANTYLASPIIRDNFLDHDDRREWENGIAKTYGDEAKAYIASNRMSSGTNISKLTNQVVRVDRLFKKIDRPLSAAAAEARQRIARIMEMFERNKFPMEYGQATYEKKIQMVLDLSDRLRDYLNSVS